MRFEKNSFFAAKVFLLGKTHNGPFQHRKTLFHNLKEYTCDKAGM